MSTTMMIGVLIVIVVAVYVLLYNSLVAALQKVKEAWSGIDVQLKLRYDLIPNLVNIVKGYAAHERNTLDAVVNARSKAIAVPDGHVSEQGQAEGALSRTLKGLFALAENYPDLKASQNFLALQKQLSETENQISASRRIYNSNVNEMNVKVQSFPSNLVAGLHRFQLTEYFELDAAEKTAVLQPPNVAF